MTTDMINRTLQVMEPVSCAEVFERDDYLYQVKWDGVRMLAFIEAGKVRLVNKRQHDRTLQYAELQGLPERLRANRAILDGEIVVLEEGKPSFPAVMSRDNLRDASRIERMSSLAPIDYMVFDILHLDGNDLMNLPLEERQGLLSVRLQEGDWLHQAENFAQGSALFNAICQLEMEGIVAKQKKGRYIGGKKHRDWLKIKYRRRETCRIGGYTLRGNLVNALLLGWEQENGLLFAGRAGSGLNSRQQEILSRYLPGYEIEGSPFINLTRRPAGYHFIEPVIQAEVEFAEWTEDLHMRAPVIKKFIDQGKGFLDE